MRGQEIGLGRITDCNKHGIDGTLGLMFKYRSTITPIFERMINQSAVTSPLFSLYFNRQVK